MTPADLRARPDPAGLDPARTGLWWAARGGWDQAHEAVQATPGAASDWVHAYLHRVEGDLENAAYWYRRAGRPVATGPLDAEWDAIAAVL